MVVKIEHKNLFTFQIEWNTTKHFYTHPGIWTITWNGMNWTRLLVFFFNSSLLLFSPNFKVSWSFFKYKYRLFLSRLFDWFMIYWTGIGFEVNRNNTYEIVRILCIKVVQLCRDDSGYYEALISFNQYVKLFLRFIFFIFVRWAFFTFIQFLASVSLITFVKFV